MYHSVYVTFVVLCIFTIGGNIVMFIANSCLYGIKFLADVKNVYSERRFVVHSREEKTDEFVKNIRLYWCRVFKNDIRRYKRICDTTFDNRALFESNKRRQRKATIKTNRNNMDRQSKFEYF